MGISELWEWLRTNKDSMLALAPFFAALAGFGGVYWAQHMTVKARREEALSEWWEERAITRTIEPVNKLLENSLSRLGKHVGVNMEPDLEIPSDCLQNLHKLTGIKDMEYLIALCKWSVDYGVSDAHVLLLNDTLKTIILQMHLLEEELWGIRIAGKKDIMTINQKPKIKKIGEAIDQTINDMGHVPLINIPPEIKEKAERLASLRNP